MSKELKLLPCPKCWGSAQMVRSWFYSRVECSRCAHKGEQILDDNQDYGNRKAAASWNELPRDLRWTTEPPKVPGHYWCRYKNEAKEAWSVAYVPAVTDWDERAMDENDRIEWAGPIPLPKEPTP